MTKVELVSKAVASVASGGVVDTDAVERDVDVIVMATGFHAADYLAGLRIVGRGGRNLHEHWAGEPRAFLGVTVPGFPNFFMLYGPGTDGGELVSMLEAQAEYAVRALKRMKRERVECHRGEADVRDLVVRLASIKDEWHLLDHVQQLLHIGNREDRDPMALGEHGLRRAHETLGSALGGKPAPPVALVYGRKSSPELAGAWFWVHWKPPYAREHGSCPSAARE